MKVIAKQDSKNKYAFHITVPGKRTFQLVLRQQDMIKHNFKVYDTLYKLIYHNLQDTDLEVILNEK